MCPCTHPKWILCACPEWVEALDGSVRARASKDSLCSGRAATSPHAACKMAGAVQGRVKKALTSSSHRSRATPEWGGGHDAVETASAALGLSRVGPSERPAAKR